MGEYDFVTSPIKDDRRKAVLKLRHLVYLQKYNLTTFRDELNTAFFTPMLPNRVECERLSLGNINYDILTPPAYVTNRIIFYVHGGSFVGGSSEAWRTFCASLANECSARVVIPDFRLAPAFAFPSAVEDIQKVFRALCTSDPASKQAAEESHEFIIAADGSGASLAFALLLSLKNRGRNKIKGMALFSPWLDVSANARIFAAKRRSDEILTADGIKNCADLYTYSSNLTNPLVSPMYIPPQSIADFPSVYIQMGEREILLQDAERFRKQLAKISVKCTLDVWQDMMHMFQMVDEYLEEAHLAVAQAARFIKAQFDGTEFSPGPR